MKNSQDVFQADEEKASKTSKKVPATSLISTGQGFDTLSINPVFTPPSNAEFKKIPNEKSQELTLGENYNLLVKGIESVKDYAIFLLDPLGRIISWNEGARRIKGYSNEEIIGQHISKFYKAEAVEKQYPQYELAEAVKKGRFEDEGWRLRKDGSSFWANIIITPIYNAKNELLGFSKVTRDLTEHKQIEEERLKAERMKILALIAPVGIMHFDANLELIYANGRACDIFNLPFEAMKGKGWLKAIEPNDATQLIQLVQRLKQNKSSGKIEHKLQGKDERALWVLSQIQPEVSTNGEIVGYIQAITDINEHKLLEQAEKEKLEALQKAEYEQR